MENSIIEIFNWNIKLQTRKPYYLLVLLILWFVFYCRWKIVYIPWGILWPRTSSNSADMNRFRNHTLNLFNFRKQNQVFIHVYPKLKSILFFTRLFYSIFIHNLYGNKFYYNFPKTKTIPKKSTLVVVGWKRNALLIIDIKMISFKFWLISTRPCWHHKVFNQSRLFDLALKDLE